MSSCAARPPTPSGRLPRRLPSRRRHRSSSVLSRLCACPRHATTCLPAGDPAAPSCPRVAAACAAPASTHSGISHAATPPPVGWSLSLVTRPLVQHTFPAFYGDVHLPATPIQRHDRLGGEHRGCACGTDQHPAGQQATRRGRRAFFMPLPTCVPGTIGLLRVQAIGRHPAPHCMLAARRAERHRQSP